MRDSERRKFKRLQVKLDLSCRLAGAPAKQTYKGQTRDVSPGGVYFHTAASVFKPGNRLNIQLSIPPTAGLLEFGGKISAIANVLRIDSHKKEKDIPSDSCGVAVQFSQSPKLCL